MSRVTKAILRAQEAAQAFPLRHRRAVTLAWMAAYRLGRRSVLTSLTMKAASARRRGEA